MLLCNDVFRKRSYLDTMCIVAIFMAEMFLYVIKFPKYKSDQIINAIFAFVYASVMLSFIYQLQETEYRCYTVWLILISSWGCDTCAYMVGMLIGRKKIFPVLSPKKSLEGCVGGVVGSVILGMIYFYSVADRIAVKQNIFGIIMLICEVGSIPSMVGDLMASAIKRNHNIKDYGNLIPGHGGIMDRFDSVIVTTPIIYFLIVLLI